MLTLTQSWALWIASATMLNSRPVNDSTGVALLADDTEVQVTGNNSNY